MGMPLNYMYTTKKITCVLENTDNTKIRIPIDTTCYQGATIQDLNTVLDGFLFIVLYTFW